MTANDKDHFEIDAHLSREDVHRSIRVLKDSKIMDVVTDLGLPVDGVIVLSGGRPIPLDQKIDDLDDMSMVVINVASGG